MLRFASVPRIAARSALPTLAVVLAACGGEKAVGPSPGDDGTFSGAVAGDLSRSITGIAYWAQASGPQAGENAFLIAMGSLTPAKDAFHDVVSISRAARDVPAPGTYQLFDASTDAEPSADEFMLVAALDAPDAQPTVCAGTSGTFTVQSTAGNRVKGSYDARATCVDPANPARVVSITLSGSFDAAQGVRVRTPNAVRLATVRVR